MRPWTAALLAALLLAVPAAAQDSDPETNCTEADPCLWTVNVGADGFTSPGAFEGPSFNGTEGDWVRFEFLSDDDAEHTISFDLNGASWQIEAFGEAFSDPILLDEVGTFALHDEPSGDELPVQVFLSDASETEDPITDVPSDTTTTADPTTDDEEGPAASLIFITLGFFAILAAMRRR